MRPWAPEHKQYTTAVCILFSGANHSVEGFKEPGLHLRPSGGALFLHGVEREAKNRREDMGLAHRTTARCAYPIWPAVAWAAAAAGVERGQQQGQLGDAGEREVVAAVYPCLAPRLVVHH